MRSARLVSSIAVLAVLLVGCQSVLARQGQTAEVSRVGWLQIIWADAEDHTAGPTTILVVDERGRSTVLDVPPDVFRRDQIRALNRNRVVVTGTWKGRAEGRLMVRSVRREARSSAPVAERVVDAPPPVIGTQRYVTILCYFSDTNMPSTPLSYFNSLMTGTAYPQMDHYWREQSYGNINLTGSLVVGWYNLGHPATYYLRDPDGDGHYELDFGALTADATARADADVYFPDFAGINMCFNQSLGCCAYGGGECLTLDGVSRCWNTTWLPPFGYQNQSVVGHEMGHSFGFPHSSGPYAETYDSTWDVMSYTYNSPQDPLYGYIGQHTIAYHKDLVGWLNGRKFVANPGTNATITLERIGQPVDTNNYQAVFIPIDDGGNLFYTIEARNLTGYDASLPGAAVIIHRLNLLLEDRVAQVVDATVDNDPNDQGAMWTPGETFVDAAAGVTVAVLSAGASSFTVQVTRAAVPGLTCQAVVPAERWRGEYFGNKTLSGTPTSVRDEGGGFIVKEYGDNGPGAFCGLPTNEFSGRFTRTIRMAAGTYRFTAESDDGFRVFLDNTPIMDVWQDGSWTRTWQGTIAEGDHVFRAEHYDAGGYARFNLRWERLDGTCVYSLTPTSAAFPQAGGMGSNVLTVSGSNICLWRATSNVPWITVTSGASGIASGTVRYTVAPNAAGAPPRSGTLTVAGQTVVVTQAGTQAPGTDTVGVYAPATGNYFLRNSNTSGAADLVFGFGPAGAGWTPLRGDWDGDGDDTPGLYDPASGAFFLKNASGAGPADVVFNFGAGAAGLVPVVGDWNNDGVDTVGVYNPTTGVFFLRNTNAAGVADVVFSFGPAGAGWLPIAGDFNGDGTDTIGLYDPTAGIFFLRNALAPGTADVVLGYGAGGDVRPVVGDWNGDGVDTVGLYNPASGFFLLRNANAPGPADVTFGYGPTNVTPIAGDWDGN